MRSALEFSNVVASMRQTVPSMISSMLLTVLSAPTPPKNPLPYFDISKGPVKVQRHARGHHLSQPLLDGLEALLDPLWPSEAIQPQALHAHKHSCTFAEHFALKPSSHQVLEGSAAEAVACKCAAAGLNPASNGVPDQSRSFLTSCQRSA